MHKNNKQTQQKRETNRVAKMRRRV